MSRRTERVADLIRQELSQVMLREVQDPRVRMSTVMAVDLSPDLRRAVVHVSVVGEEAERLEAIAGLEHAKGFIRSALAHRLHLRVVPELTFRLDRGPEYSQQIADLLESLHDLDPNS